MNRINHLFVFFFLLISCSAWAQEEETDEDALQQIENLRVGMITNRLKLTTEQAKKFWPVYEQLSQERQALRKDMKLTIEKEADSDTDEQITKNLWKVMEIREKEAALEKKYLPKLLEVLTPKQVVKLLKVEVHFRRYLLEQLRHRGRPDKPKGRGGKHE
jgi:Spy/CpxP family protein refolding chaperone